jgi:hypothetical protein
MQEKKRMSITTTKQRNIKERSTIVRGYKQKKNRSEIFGHV